MTTQTKIIHEAIERVEREQRLLSIERRQFRKFRETVSRARVGTSDTSSSLSTDLVETYRETVMGTPDFDAAYNESLRESLEEELSPSLAKTLLSDDSFTQKCKRDLLLQTNTAIKKREDLLAVMEHEKESLNRILSELAEIQPAVEELPTCSSQKYALDDLIDIWKAYNKAEQRCKRLLNERQQHLHKTTQQIEAVNKYLYQDLETQFPALFAITATIESIDSSREGVSSKERVLSD